MKKLNILFIMLAALCVGAGNAWAQTPGDCFYRAEFTVSAAGDTTALTIYVVTKADTLGWHK
jgi:hypothetical protein